MKKSVPAPPEWERRELMQPEELLGLRYDSIEVSNWIAALGGTPEIEDDDGLVFLEVKPVGLGLVADGATGVVRTVFLYGEGVESFGAYPLALPGGLAFGEKRSGIESRLGRTPDFTGPKHDAWDLESHRLIVEYDGEAICQVSLTTFR